MFQDGIWSVCFNVVVCERIKEEKQIKEKKGEKKKKKKGKVLERRK